MESKTDKERGGMKIKWCKEIFNKNKNKCLTCDIFYEKCTLNYFKKCCGILYIFWLIRYFYGYYIKYHINIIRGHFNKNKDDDIPF